jgi:Protein of unknown function (DUF3592)
MGIPIPVGNHHYATVHETVRKDVVCENCRCGYFYEHTAVSTGSAFSFLFMDEEGAKRTAAERARAGLAGELQKASPAPCPECGCYQAAMVSVLRQSRRYWLWVVAVALMLAAVVLLVISLMTGDLHRLASGHLAIWPILSVVVGSVGVAAAAVRWRDASQYDPNMIPTDERLAIARRTSFRADRPDDYVAAKRATAEAAAAELRRTTSATPRAWLVTQIVLIAGTVLISGGVAGWFWFPVARGIASESWPTAKATVIDAGYRQKVVRDRGQFQTTSVPSISYRYQVDGVEHQSSAIGTNPEAGVSDPTFPQSTPPGATITIRYDPADPAQAVWKPGPSPLDWFAFVIPMVVGMVVLGTIVFFAYHDMRQRAELRRTLAIGEPAADSAPVRN